jgi:predicted TIM-barrel fold metal-dependent hydrolase
VRSSDLRYRRIPGGLDNAVKQAEQRGLYDLFIVDSDCHQNEPFTLFAEYLPDKWKREYSGSKFLDFVMEFKKYAAEPDDFEDPVKVNLLKLSLDVVSRYPRNLQPLMAGRIRRPEVGAYEHFPIKEKPEKFPIREQKPEEIIDMFTRRMHDIGIKRSIIFPNTLLVLGNYPNFELETVIANAYIDYMLDNFLDRYPEILSVIYAPANSPHKVAELIDRVGNEKGVAGVMMTPSRPGPLAGDESWNPIYEAAQQKGLPICFHSEANILPPFDRFKKFLPIHALSFPWYLILQLTSIVLEGVPVRFPNLNFVFMEGGITWIPWIMRRLDSEYLMRRSEAPTLTKLPSEYIKKFYFTQQPLEHTNDPRELEWVFRSFNAETQLLYASDYPHFDFDVPSVIYDLPFLSKDAKKLILGENARKLFRIN